MIRRRPSSTRGGPRPLPRRKRVDAVARLGWRERIFWGTGLVLVVLGLVYLLRSIFAMLFASIVFAYLLDPLVDRLEARGWRRELGIGVVFTGILGLLVFSVLIIVPSVAKEFVELSENVGPYLDELSTRLVEWQAIAEQRLGRPIPLTAEGLLAEMEHALAEGDADTEGGVANIVKDAAPDVGGRLATLLKTALSGGMTFVVGVLNLALLPIFTFYLLRDWDKIIAGIDDMIPPRNRRTVRRLAADIDERLASFVRGQSTVAAALGVLYSTGLLIVGIDLPIVVGMTAGVLGLIPYLGNVVGIVIASILAVLKFGLDWHLPGVWAVFMISQGIEGFILTPNIVGDKVGLHPFVVMLALLVGGNLFGIWGMLFAIPVTAAAQVLMMEWYGRYKASLYFGEEDE
ncbi:MAG: AI-2E family transporter [Proteobacteria bacterium]|nr:AI-2E family transporter [Pseudomonadota bacterium]